LCPFASPHNSSVSLDSKSNRSMERDRRHDGYFVQIEVLLGNPRQFGIHCSRTCSEGYASHRKLLEKNILDTRAYICANNDTWGCIRYIGTVDCVVSLVLRLWWGAKGVSMSPTWLTRPLERCAGCGVGHVCDCRGKQNIV
jgi:hypothetical protein